MLMKNRLGYILSTIVLHVCCLNVTVFGQQDYESIPSPIYIGAKVHYGFIIPHHQDLKAISEANIWGIQLEISKLKIRPQSWDNCNCYYRMGLSFNYYDYRNPDVLGHSYNLILFFEPYLNFKGASRLSFRTGMGLTYLDQVYDVSFNPENLFYSSKISGILTANITYNYIINDSYQVNLSANYNHISNAGVKMPNKGMNFPTLSIGMDYIFRPVPLEPQVKSTGLRAKKVLYYLNSFWAIRTVNADSLYPEQKKIMAGISGGLIRGLSNINGLLLGAEISYDASYKELSRRWETGFLPWVISLHLGNSFVIGRVTFTQELAYYVLKPSEVIDKSVFQRYGLYYRLGKNLNAGFSLKAYGHVAEHMDVRVGIMF